MAKVSTIIAHKEREVGNSFGEEEETHKETHRERQLKDQSMQTSTAI